MKDYKYWNVFWALMIVCLPLYCSAESGKSRGGTWELHLPLSYAEDADFSGMSGSSVSLNDDLGFGFGGGYNFTDRLQFTGLLQFHSRSYDATVVRDDGSTKQYANDMESSTISLNGTYYFLDGDITPFLIGSIGYTFVDTNIQDGPAEGVCWWDPWWGYICSEYVPTKTETDMSYGAGAGIRIDITENFGLQCSYSRNWVDIENASGTPEFDMWRLDIIIRN